MIEPKLRFKADDGSQFPDWEEKTLGDIGTAKMCKRVLKEQTSEKGDVPFYKIGTFGGTPDAFISRELYEELKAKYSFPRKGNILLSAAGTIGRTVVYDGQDAFFQDSNIVWLDNDDSVLDGFLLQFYNKTSWDNLEGGTIKRLYNGLFLSKVIHVPSLPEQQKIAEFLSTIDTVIEKQKETISAWEERKKGVMQKLFSQEVRFKADDGSEFPEWEEKKLGDVCEYGKGQSVGINYVGTENMNQNFSGVDSLDSTNEVNGMIYCVGDTLMSNIRPYLKKTWKADRNGVCSTDVLVFRPVNIDSDFLYYNISSEKFVLYVMTGVKGSKMPRGDKGHIMEYDMPIPCLTEQQKIADCLSSLDEVIKKQKATLTAWKELKKGLLQQMFV